MNNFPGLQLKHNAADARAEMTDIDQGSSFGNGYRMILAPHFYRPRHVYSWFAALMNDRIGRADFRRASGNQLVLFEFKNKLFLGNGGPVAEQFQERIVLRVLLRRGRGTLRRIGGAIVPIESLRLNQHLGNGVWTGSDLLDQLFQPSPVLERAGQELDSHAEFGIHDPYFSCRLDRTIGGSEQQLDPRLGGKGGRGSQETSTKTEPQQRAADGRIVLLSALQTQPFFQALVRGIGERRKLDAGATARILPGDHPGGFDHGRGVRQREGKGDQAGLLARRTAKSHRDSALAQPRDGGLLAISILESEICGDVHFQPHRPPPLSFHESSGSSKTGLYLFRRDRFVDYEVCPELECGLQIGAGVDNGDRHRLTILLPGTDTGQ